MIGFIYCIIDNTNGKYYIGSTIRNIGERLQNHEYHYNYYIQGKTHYISSFEIITNNDYSIYLIKEIDYDEDDEDQLLWLERNFIEDGWLEGNCVNKKIPIITDEENIERYNEYNYQYYIDNRERLLEYKKQNRIDKIEYYKNILNILDINTQILEA